MNQENVSIKTHDGICKAQVLKPSGKGHRPVLVLSQLPR